MVPAHPPISPYREAIMSTTPSPWARNFARGRPSHNLPTITAAMPVADLRGFGNLGGPGNPFARRVAELRSVLLECVTKEDMQFIAGQLVDMSAHKAIWPPSSCCSNTWLANRRRPSIPTPWTIRKWNCIGRHPTPEEFHEVSSEHAAGRGWWKCSQLIRCRARISRCAEKVLVGGLRRIGTEAQAAGQAMDMEERWLMMRLTKCWGGQTTPRKGTMFTSSRNRRPHRQQTAI